MMSTVTSPHDDLDSRVRAALHELAKENGSIFGAHIIFDAMAASRHIDIVARRLREHGRGHYTIGSAGHESNAIVAAALRPTDPALLHYRSGGFYLSRSLQAARPLADGIRDVLLSMMGGRDDPASGGRHKVFGSPALSIIPQTSTIASHLPRAVGVAFAIDRAARLGLETRWPADAITVTSLGDASLNHSTAVGALNTAGYCAETGLGMPLLVVCEDNGIGISVPSPAGWVAQAAHRPGLSYAYADGHDPDMVAAVTAELVDRIRQTRRPGLLHLRTVRFLGHAGTDVESTYRTPAAIRADLELDPILAWATSAPGDWGVRYEEIGALVSQIADEVADAVTLTERSAVMAPLTPHVPAAPQAAVASRELQPGVTLAQSINRALSDALAARENMLVFGEDVGRKGGVYGVTRGLAQRFRSSRVFDTLLDEQAILGLALGTAVSGFLPVPEIQYLAYLHNAEDQLRGEAASLRFFSNATFTNPMVVRVAGLAYQKGFGGHFHNDNALGVLRDIPGLVLAVPARPDDAGPMLRACLAAAAESGQVSVYLEPIALYHERDLLQTGDGGWLANYDSESVAEIGRARTHGDGSDLTIVTFGNGVRMSLRVADRLQRQGIAARVVDLRWVAPLPVEDILHEAVATGRVLIADETRHNGGVGEGVITALVEGGFTGRMARVSSADSYIPLGHAANLVLLSEDDIERCAHQLLAEPQ